MRDQLEALRKLSDIDVQLAELNRQLEEIPAQVKELDAEVEVLRNLLDKERQQLAEAEEWDKQAEKELKMQEELLTKSRSKQANARNERELNAAQREIETIKKAMSDKEEDRIRLLEAMGERRESVAKHEAEIDELQKVLDGAEAEAREKALSVEAAKEDWVKKRATAVEKLRPRILKLYEHIRTNKPNAIVELVDETCLGCNMSLPPQIYIDVQRMNRIYQCPYCKRIIYFKPRDEE